MPQTPADFFADAMSLTPRDLDFMEAKHAAAREIALAIGVPPMLLGIPGDNTYWPESPKVLDTGSLASHARRLS